MGAKYLVTCFGQEKRAHLEPIIRDFIKLAASATVMRMSVLAVIAFMMMESFCQTTGRWLSAM